MRRSGGFTVLELMMVITIMAILASMAIPGFGYLSASTKVKSASTELFLAMYRARSESVKRNRGVAVVANADGWAAGWQVIVDGNRDGDYADIGGGDTVVATQSALQRVTINLDDDAENPANTPDADSGAAEDDIQVEYRPNGRISGTAPAFDVASADSDYDLKRCLSADLTGKPYVRSTVCP